MKHESKDKLEFALTSADICQLLAISLRNPDATLAEGLLCGSFLDDAKELLKEAGAESDVINQMTRGLQRYLGEQQEVSFLLSALRQEYTRLFIDPIQPVIQIYETTFCLDGDVQDKRSNTLFISDSALDAERQYKQAGLFLATDHREPADHLATEMEFMMYLHTQKAIAIQQGDKEQIEWREKQIRKFTESHLNTWLKDFADDLERQSSQDFYRWLAMFLKVFTTRLNQVV
jgi:TorA maturation chaperone TorD